MKKTILALSILSIALVACSKPNNDKPAESSAAPVTASQPVDAASAVAASTTNTTATPTGDTAELSLDWSGEYKGIYPCADCEGIKTELELKSDKTYELTQEYIGRGKDNESKVKGTFTFDSKNPSVITLDEAGDKRKFFIGENFVEARDMTTGKPLETKLNYKLIKESK